MFSRKTFNLARSVTVINTNLEIDRKSAYFCRYPFEDWPSCRKLRPPDPGNMPHSPASYGHLLQARVILMPLLLVHRDRWQNVGFGDVYHEGCEGRFVRI